jgi:hypothetical protein
MVDAGSNQQYAEYPCENIFGSSHKIGLLLPDAEHKKNRPWPVLVFLF